MTSLVRTELLRIRTTRTAWVLVTLFLALTAARMALIADSIGSVDGPQPGSIEVRDMFVGSGGLAALLLPMLLGALGTTGEFHHRTATGTFLVVPDRRRVIAAKVLTYTLVGLGIGVALVSLGIAATAAAGAAGQLDLHFAARGLGVLLVAGWAGAFGVCLGTVVRSSTVATLAPLVWFVVVETLLTAFQLNWLMPWTPGGATFALSGADMPRALPTWAALIVLAGYAASFGVPGTRRVVRADIG